MKKSKERKTKKTRKVLMLADSGKLRNRTLNDLPETVAARLVDTGFARYVDNMETVVRMETTESSVVEKAVID